LAKYYVENEKKRQIWQKILIKIGRQTKNPLGGEKGYQITAINAITDESLVLFVENAVI
jgi:hypothetical protein